jgi:hypothetical protein
VRAKRQACPAALRYNQERKEGLMEYVWLIIYTIGVLIVMGILSSAFVSIANGLIQETEGNEG